MLQTLQQKLSNPFLVFFGYTKLLGLIIPVDLVLLTVDLTAKNYLLHCTALHGMY
jgi:hypothetical protein